MVMRLADERKLGSILGDYLYHFSLAPSIDYSISSAMVRITRKAVDLFSLGVTGL